MRLSLILICLSLLLSSYNGYLKCEQCATSDLKGKVKTLTVTMRRHDRKDSWLIKKKTYHYDIEGNLLLNTDTTYFCPDSLSVPLPKDLYSTKTTYSYKEGKLFKEVFTNGEGREQEKDYAYDDKGRQILDVTHWPEGDLIKVTRFNDNDHSFITSVTFKNKDGHPEDSSMTLSEYDSNGYVIMEKAFTIGVNGERRMTGLTVENVYDKFGNIVETKNSNGINTSTHLFEFDENRLVRQYHKLSFRPTRWETIYSDFDDHGNYRTTIFADMDNVHPSEFTTRHIEYYP